MATVVNDRDVLIMAAVPRFAAPTDRGFFVNPEQAIFKVTNGVASPSSFNFNATLLNVTGTVSYVPSAGLSISVSGNNCSLDYSNMTAATGTVTATLVFDGVTYTRTINVSKVVDGIAPKILDLAASSQVFKVDKAGAGSPGSIELVAYGQNLTGTPNFTILAGTSTLTIGSDNTRKQLTFANMSTDLVTVQVAQDGQTDTVTIVKVREGADGANAVTGFMTNEAQTVPANLDGSVISMTGATTGMKVFVGLTDDTANWTYTGNPASSANAITYTLGASSGVLTASALNAGVDAAYVDVTATRLGYPSVTKRFSLAKSKTGPMGQTGQTGQDGTRGNVNLSVLTGGSAWSDAEANAAVVNMASTTARSRDVVNLYRADRTWAQKRVFDGFNWSILADAFDGAIMVKGSVLADAIDARGLSIKDLQGNVLLGVNVPLAASLAAAGTLNSDLTASIAAAQKAGTDAAAAALTANAAIAVIGNDYILDKSEKPRIITEFSAIDQERTGIAKSATDLGISADAYQGTINNLASFLVNNVGSKKGEWSDVTVDSAFDGPYMRDRFVDIYNARQVLLNAVAAKLQANAAAAALTSTWSGVTGVLKPEDSATRGATFGTNISGQIKPDNVAQFIAPNTIGNTQFGGDMYSADWNGYTDYRMRGWYLQRTGNIFVNNLKARGAIMGGDYDGPAWPDATNRADGSAKRGFYLGDESLLMGNPNRGGYFQVTYSGNIYAPGFTLENSQLTLTSPLIITPRVQTTFAISIPGISARSQVNTNSYQSFGTMSAAMANGVGPFRYLWTLSVDGGDVKMVGDPTVSTVQIQARGTNSFCNAYLNLTVTDSNGAQAASGSNISIQFGSGVPQ